MNKWMNNFVGSTDLKAMHRCINWRLEIVHCMTTLAYYFQHAMLWDTLTVMSHDGIYCRKNSFSGLGFGSGEVQSDWSLSHSVSELKLHLGFTTASITGDRPLWSCETHRPSVLIQSRGWDHHDWSRLKIAALDTRIRGSGAVIYLPRNSRFPASYSLVYRQSAWAGDGGTSYIIQLEKHPSECEDSCAFTSQHNTDMNMCLTYTLLK